MFLEHPDGKRTFLEDKEVDERKPSLKQCFIWDLSSGQSRGRLLKFQEISKLHLGGAENSGLKQVPEDAEIDFAALKRTKEIRTLPSICAHRIGLYMKTSL